MPMSEYMQEIRSLVGNRLLEVPSVAILVRDGAGRVLLVQHENDGSWVTPGGAVEPLEVPGDAAVREAWEETGLHVELTGIVGVYGGPGFVVEYRNGDRTSYLMVAFEARSIGGTLRPDDVETLAVGYFSRDEIAALPHPEWLDEILADVFAERPCAAFRPAAWSPQDS